MSTPIIYLTLDFSKFWTSNYSIELDECKYNYIILARQTHE